MSSDKETPWNFLDSYYKMFIEFYLGKFVENAIAIASAF